MYLKIFYKNLIIIFVKLKHITLITISPLVYNNSKMSKKYVPSFLKNQQTETSSLNSFAPLSDDYIAPTSQNNYKGSYVKHLVNTSRPAKEAPTLVPATLASLTANKSSSNTSSNINSNGKSFSANFAERINGSYIQTEKPVDITSFDEFPALGGSALGGVSKKYENNVSSVEKDASSFANKTKLWAAKQKEEEELNRLEELRQQQLRKDSARAKEIALINLRRNGEELFRSDDSSSDDEEFYQRQYDQSSLADSDESFEVPEFDDESMSEDSEESGEINQNIGWDGRRRNDLY